MWGFDWIDLAQTHIKTAGTERKHVFNKVSSTGVTSVPFTNLLLIESDENIISFAERWPQVASGRFWIIRQTVPTPRVAGCSDWTIGL